MAGTSAARFGSGAAVVAGGSGGLGRAICLTLASAGSDVALTYNRNAGRAKDVAQEIERCGRRTLATQVNLGDPQAVQQFVGEAVEVFGGVHTVVYAAGPYIHMRHVSAIEPSLFEDTVSADLFSFYNLVHATIPELRKTRGVLVALVTAALKRYAKTDVLSVAPKAAVEAVTRAVAAEEGRYGVRANCVGVGLIGDGMFHQLKETGDFSETWLAAARRNVALGRWGSAQEVADAVSFLASDKASFITGQVLTVDGGYAV